MSNPYRFLATSDHPLARAARGLRKAVADLAVPAPRPVVVPIRIAFEAAREAYYFGARVLVSEPMLKAYAKEYGKGVHSGTFVHFIRGNGDLVLGDDVTLDGQCIIIFAARFAERPTLTIGDGSGVGHECRFTVGKSITVGKHCRIASRVVIFDSNGHPADPEARLAGAPPAEDEVRPVVIEDNVWIGMGAMIFPGVTVGEGSVVSAGAVVLSDVPPYTVVAGNPARAVRSLRDRPPAPASRADAAPEPPPAQAAASAPKAATSAPAAAPVAAYQAQPQQPQQPQQAAPASGMDVVTQTILKLAKLPRIGADDDMQFAGVTSLQMFELRNRLEDAFGLELPDDRWTAARTPRALWSLIESLGGKTAQAAASAPAPAPAQGDGRTGAVTPAAATPASASAANASAPAGPSRLRRVEVELKLQAAEMAQEEIPKKIAFLDKEIRNIRFLRNGAALEFEAPEDRADALATEAIDVAYQMQRSLRGLQRRIVYRSPQVDRPTFRGTGMTKGIVGMGRGQVALEGTALRLYRYFDRTLANIGDPFAPEPMLTPTLIPATTLSKCDYFRSFPHIVTFTTHLPEDMPTIEGFRTRHQDREDVDDRALSDMVTPEACLSPAVCYHVYAANRDRVIPAAGLRYAVVGRCFRYESSKMVDLRRLWEFTMREVVLLGSRENVLGLREQGNDIVSRYLADHEIAGEIRTASDPFFIAPDADAKTYFQLSSDTKWEISLCLPDDERLAAGSLNYHSDFFGRAFSCDVEGAGPMHSVCIAFGLERWVYAFLAQHGDDPSRWPEIVQRAPEMLGVGGRGATVAVPAGPAWGTSGSGEVAKESAPAAQEAQAAQAAPAAQAEQAARPSRELTALTVERGDPTPVVEAAGRILRAAWAPPVLHYSDAYLKWQFGFPGGPAVAGMARDAGELAALIVATPRRFRFRGAASRGYLLSFLAVDPSLQGKGIAGKVYDEVLRGLRKTGLLTVVYLEAHSEAAQRSLSGSVKRVGFQMKKIGQYVNHGFAASSAASSAAPGALAAREARDLGEVLAAIDACKAPEVLWSAPDRAQLEHYLRDPRGRKMLVVEEEGRVTGAAMVFLSELTNKEGGLDRVATVDALFIPEPTVERVTALFRGAAEAFAGQTTGPVVSAPNVALLPPEVVRAAKIRPTGAVYEAYAIHGEGHPFMDAELSNLEIV